MFEGHKCKVCPKHVSLFKAWDTDGLQKAQARLRQQKHCTKTKNQSNILVSTHDEAPMMFPPLPLMPALLENIVEGFCADTSPSLIEEAGCAVCGQLHPLLSLNPLSQVDYLSLLEQPAITCLECASSSEEIRVIPGPVIDRKCTHICVDCESSLLSKKRPKLAMANGLWIGDIPNVLKGLTFTERMMIACIRHNRCVVRVSSGRAKMVANRNTFQSSTDSDGFRRN